MKLTGCQSRALKNLIKWYHSGTDIALLQGNAGTGKTTIVKQLLDNLPNCRPLVLAPFNEAVKQLERSIGNKYPLKTVCAALQYTMQQTENGLELKQVNNVDLSKYNLLIVDEVSTLNETLLNELENLHMYTLFIGHKSQLPPVDTNVSRYDKCISPAFTRDYLTINLHETVRHTGELADFCNLAESLIYKVGILPNKYIDTLTNVKEYLDTYEGCEKLFSGKLKFLAWTNEKVDFYNQLARSILFPKNSDYFVVDDRVILNSPAYGFITELDDYATNLNKLANKKALLHSTNTKGVVINVRNKMILNLLCWELVIRTDSYLAEGTLNYFYVPVDKMEYNYLHAKYKRTAMFAKEADKVKAFKNLQSLTCLFADIKHNFAMTVHKCLPYDSKVLTPTGYKELKSLQIGDYVISGNNTIRKITLISYTGKKEKFFIKTQSNGIYYSSSEHRFRTHNGAYVQASNLKVGDYLSIFRSNEYFYFDKVIEVGSTGTICDMMDIEVEKEHNFIYEGAVVHNSQGSTIEIVVVDDGDINRCENVTLKKKLRYVAYSRAKEKLIRLS